MIDRRTLIFAGLAGPAVLTASLARAATAPPSLYDILREPELLDAALSPSGKTVALLGESIGAGGARTTYLSLINGDDPSGPSRRLNLGDVDLEQVAWASNDRLLVWLKKEIHIATSGPRGSASVDTIARRLVAINVDGSGVTPLLNDDKRKFRGNLNLGEVIDYMPSDPRRMLMQVADYSRGVWALYRVDVVSGESEFVERGGDYTIAWWSQDGVPVVRYDVNARNTVVTLSIRAPGETEWVAYHRARRDEQGRLDFNVVANGEAPGTVLIAARLDGDETTAVRPFDLKTRQFGSKVIRRVAHDVEQVVTDRAGRMIAAAFIEDRVSYEFTDSALKGHHKALEGFFDKVCNVELRETDTSGNRFLWRVNGPREPGAWFLYDKATGSMEALGAERPWLTPDRLAKVEILKVSARDGQPLTAYLTVPVGAGPRPLVVLAHGGPELRDSFGWDDWAQTLAANGWFVLQPNFRGSDGYGRDFMEAGRRRWGDLMQQDIEDCVVAVIASGRVASDRIAIMGASYGGYAALMGPVLRPDLYKAAVSIAGVSDLPAMMAWERQEEGDASPAYDYWKKVIGDPDTEGARLMAASPARRADSIAAPVLLIHGAEDAIVPVAQSKLMLAALKRARRPVDYLEIKDMGHRGWSPQESQKVLGKSVEFLKGNLG
jgi:dipeptidyl aminopeptidase/acylaminoacyl peptidase